MKKVNIDESLRVLLKNQKVPVLILDERWHKLFPPETKPTQIRQLETRLEDLLKEQGKLVNELKELKVAKKKLMDGVVANMGDMGEFQDKKAKKSKDLILEMNERIEQDTERVMDMPYLIKEANQQLLVAGIKICYNKLDGKKEELEELINEINIMREILKSKAAYRLQMEQERDFIYTLMHDMLGPKIIQIFDDDSTTL